ncbi:ATP-binding protein [Synechococcus sp. CS-1332]|uniref:ATP-binding protein n=1 Tax=Synechococcus sp. CS-1332 TaxID=2847972 RepID=UPI00223AE145|nr:ATP-binding protein [Synechococcus sp. CS-1332]MCT0208927.1 ATP-binding protein [Synechococcus sp. CS-1332]
MAPPQPDVLSLSVQPTPLELRRCSIWLTESCQTQAVPSGPAGKLDLCLNEVLANLIDHAGAADFSAPVDLSLELADCGDRGLATLTIIDTGPAFDPLGVSRGPLPRSLADAEPGGLGLLLVRRFMDERSYERAGDRNVLKLGIYWPKGP